MKTAATLKGILLGSALFGSLGLMAPATQGGVFLNISVDGSVADWNGVSPLYTGTDDGHAKEIQQIFLANDDTYFYVRVDFFRETNPNELGGFYLGFDNDSNSATGFNVYGQGVVGTEGAYQNDFPFEQASGGVFNTGATFSAGAGAGISPYNVSTLTQEYRILRSVVIDTDNNQLLFPNSSFNFVAYFDDGNSEIAGPISYTFASVPEPSAIGLLALGAISFLARRRRA